MPDSNRPDNAGRFQRLLLPKPTEGDPLPWWATPAILVSYPVVAPLGRAYPWAATAVAVLALLLHNEIVDRWNDRRRFSGGAIASVFLIFVCWWTVPLDGPWWRTALAIGGGMLIVPWTTWRVRGGVGTRTREVDKIAAALPMVMAANSPKMRGPDGQPVPVVKVGKVRADQYGHVVADYFARSPKFDGAEYAHYVAADLHVPTHLVTDLNLSAAVAAGEHKLTVRAFPSFAMDPPAMPDPANWPKGKMPLGWDANGEIVWLPMLDSDAMHMLIGGTSGSGKSNFIRHLALAYRAMGWQVWGGDGSGGSLGLEALSEKYKTTDDECYLLLDEAWQLMRQRESEIGPGGMHAGPGILVVIDESGSVMRSKSAALAAKEIAARGRKARMALVLGLQSAYVSATGGGETLANLPTRVAFRTMGEKYNRMILMDNQPGYLSHEIGRENRGECVIRGMPHADWVRMRTWEVTDLPSAPSVHPTPCPDYPGETAPDTPRTDTPRTDTPDAQAPQYDDRIADLLTHVPVSGRAMAEYVKCSPDTANKALKRLADQGRAVSTPKGWIHPMFAEDAA